MSFSSSCPSLSPSPTRKRPKSHASTDSTPTTHDGFSTTIRRARKKVADAEEAEKQADIALNEARERVREAHREYVQLLEQEAIDTSR